MALLAIRIDGKNLVHEPNEPKGAEANHPRRSLHSDFNLKQLDQLMPDSVASLRVRLLQRSGRYLSGLRGGCSGFEHLLDRHGQAGFLVGAGVAMQHPHLDRLVDLAEGGVHGALNRSLGLAAGLLAVGRAGREAALQQRAQGGLVGAVPQTVALGDFDALLG